MAECFSAISFVCKNKGDGDVSQSNISGIYKIENLVNGKMYVGSAVDIKNRWSRHKSDLRKNKHHSRYLQRSWNKYSEEQFEFTIIEEVKDVSELLEREQYWLDYYKSYDYKIGYNSYPTAGSPLGAKHSRETILKSKHTIPVLQIDLEGNVIKEWYGAREASNVLKIKQDCIWNCCHYHRKTYKGYIWIFKTEYEQGFDLNYYENLTKPIQINQYGLNNEFIKTWSGSYGASKELDIDNSSITKCCKGKYKTAGGYIWSYAS